MFVKRAATFFRLTWVSDALFWMIFEMSAVLLSKKKINAIFI